MKKIKQTLNTHYPNLYGFLAKCKWNITGAIQRVHSAQIKRKVDEPSVILELVDEEKIFPELVLSPVPLVDLENCSSVWKSSPSVETCLVCEEPIDPELALRMAPLGDLGGFSKHKKHVTPRVLYWN